MLPIPDGWGQMPPGFSGLGLRAGDLVGLPARRPGPLGGEPFNLARTHIAGRISRRACSGELLCSAPHRFTPIPLSLSASLPWLLAPQELTVPDSMLLWFLGAIRTAAAMWLALASPLSRQSLTAPQIHLLGGEGLTGSNFWILSLGFRSTCVCPERVLIPRMSQG